MKNLLDVLGPVKVSPLRLAKAFQKNFKLSEEDAVKEVHAVSHLGFDRDESRLNGSAVRVEWDEKNKKQVEDAKTLYIRARLEHRKILDADGGPLENFRPYYGCFIIAELELKPGEFAMRIIDKTGDRRLIWDSSRPDQVEEAANIFEDYMKKGWKAYGVNEHGEKSRRINGFNGSAQEILFDEKPGVKEKLKSFIEKFRRVEVVPRTYPG